MTKTQSQTPFISLFFIFLSQKHETNKKKNHLFNKHKNNKDYMIQNYKYTKAEEVRDEEKTWPTTKFYKEDQQSQRQKYTQELTKRA